MLKRTHTSSDDDDFITPKSSNKRPKIIKSKKMETQITSSSSPAAPSDVLPNGIQFLNYLKNDIADDFSDEITDKLPELINSKNLEGCTVDELVELKGFDGRDGKFFEEWLKCTFNPSSQYCSIHIRLNGRYSSIYKTAQEFYNDTKISGFKIYPHHIVLRAKEQKKLPLMSTAPESYSCSHLCDSSGCLRKEHLELELFSFNASRKLCSGVILLQIRDHITDVSPCIHGSTHPKFKKGGDELQFACRKIRVEKLSL